METVGTLSKWSPSSNSPVGIASYDNSASVSLPPGMMDDLPFCLEDLPPEIRDKIDDIIEKNEDLESQLDAIDTLLFANRPQVKFDVSSKLDLGNESGIGSDSDSGHGVVPAPDQLTTTSSIPSRAQQELLENAKTFGPLLRTSAVNDEVDDFISRIIVPPPPHLTGYPRSPVGQRTPPKELTFTPRSALPTISHPRATTASVSTTSTTRKSEVFEGDLPINLPPPPLEFGESPKKPPRGPSSPPPDEAVTVVRTGQNFLVTVDVPRSLMSNGSPAGDSSCSNVTRVHVGKGETELPVKVTSVPVSRSVHQQSVTTAADSSAARSSQLYAWNKSPVLGTIRECPPDKPTKKSLTLPVKPQRPSDLDVSKEKQPRFWKKGKDKYVSSDLISTPSRYSQVTYGPTIDMRKKKWRPMSDVLSEGSRSGSLDSGEAEGVGKDGMNAASDDDLSSIVVMRLKNGKPAQPPKIDSRTLKAQSMLSLYDPSSDLKGRSKDKKTDKTKTKVDPFAFFRAKTRRHHTDVRERPSSERPLSMDASTSRDSEMEPLRSDYLFLIPPPPLSLGGSRIPSPSLYSSSVDSRSSRQMRSPPPPGDISDILRIDVRDLEVGGYRRYPMTFETFRGEIQPIRWSEEKTRFPVSNRWSHRVFDEIESPDGNSSALASRCSLPVYLTPVDVFDNSGLPTSAAVQDAVQRTHPSRPFRPSPMNERRKGHQTLTTTEPSRTSSPSILGLDGDSTPVTKVRSTTLATPAPQLPRVMTPTEPQMFTPSVTTAAAGGTRLSIASSCFRNAILEDTGNGSESRWNSGATPVPLPLPRNHHLTPSYSSPRLDVTKAAPSRLSPRQSFAGSAESHEPPRLRISPCPSTASFETIASVLNNDDVDSVNWNGLEETLVLQTTYETETAGGRAEDDIRRMLSSLETQREWLLSAGSTSCSSSPKLFRSRKDSLASRSRRLVTDAKLMVSAATRSRHELTSTLTPAVHTVAKVFDACRHVLAVVSPGVCRTMLLDQVLDVGWMFLDTLTSANLAAGRGHDDPAMEQLMARTTALAQALYKLVNTTKSLDGGA